MFVYTDDFFNSLEGESHYPALQRKNTQDSSPRGFINLCSCSACCLFSYFLGNFPEHVTSLPSFETVSLAWWRAPEARIALQTAKLVRFSFSFFPPHPPQLSAVSDFSLLSGGLNRPPLFILLVWPGKQARRWAREREMVASLLPLHCLAEQR